LTARFRRLPTDTNRHPQIDSTTPSTPAIAFERGSNARAFWRNVTCNGHHRLVAALGFGEFRDRMEAKIVEAESIGRCLNITTVCSSSTPRVPNLAAAFISSVRPCDFQQVRPNAYRFYLPHLGTRAGFSSLAAMAPSQRWEDVKLSPNWSRILRTV
jgi:hypothetical protein